MEVEIRRQERFQYRMQRRSDRMYNSVRLNIEERKKKIGLFLNMFIESLIMITPFMLLRKFTGGFHFQSAKVCLAITVVVLTCGMLLQKLVLKANNSNMLTIIVALSTVIILIFSPIKSSSAMHNKNYLFFRKMSRAL